jgi:hypothetical protein
MGLRIQYAKLSGGLKEDFDVAACSVGLRTIFKEEIRDLDQDLRSLQIPAMLTTESAITFCLHYRELRERKEYLKEFLALADASQQAIHGTE